MILVAGLELTLTSGEDYKFGRQPSKREQCSYENEPIDPNAAGEEYARKRGLLLRDAGF
jgi:hypothetical protein